MASGAIAALAETKPEFHGSADAPTSWASQNEVLEFIANSLNPGMNSLETGCGYSTVVFASTGSRHTVVTPARLETRQVADYCRANRIDIRKVKFAIGKSQDVLPGLVNDGRLDLVYIDGAHRFPFPCIDWVYTEGRLNVGGLMLVDDVRIPTCRILHDFLMKESNWSLERYIRDTAVFRKIGPTDYSADWPAQSYNSDYPDWSFLPVSQRLRRSRLLRLVTGRR